MGCFLACFEASGNEVEKGVRRLLARVLFVRLPRCNGEFRFVSWRSRTAHSRLRIGSATACQPLLSWNHVVSLPSRLGVFHGPFLICSSFLAGVVHISR